MYVHVHVCMHVRGHKCVQVHMEASAVIPQSPPIFLALVGRYGLALTQQSRIIGQ